MKNKIQSKLLKLARRAYNKGDIPVASLIVKNNKIIASAYNKKHNSNVPFYHAELLAIRKACKKLKTWHLDDCVLYVTLEPCPMCTYAIAEARIEKVYYMINSNYYDAIDNKLNKIKKIKIENEEYLIMLKEFFTQIRNKFKKM